MVRSNAETDTRTDAARDVSHLGIVLETADPERAWNALRLGITALEDGRDASVFLLGDGVEVERVTDERFDVRERLGAFVDAGGEVLACGTCLEVREREGSAVCPVSTMRDLLDLVTTADRVLTIG